MSAPRCPGQDQRYWTFDAIFDVACPFCANEIEFWKDEPVRICPSCGKEVRNPRIDMGCAKWCKYAAECLGAVDGQPGQAMSLIERLAALVALRLKDQPRRAQSAERSLAEAAKRSSRGDPLVIQAAALLAGGSFDAADAAGILQRSGVPDEAGRKVVDILNALSAGGVLKAPEFAAVAESVRQSV